MTARTIVVTVAPELAEIVTDRMWQWGVQAVSEAVIDGGRIEVTTSVGNDPAAIDRAMATLDAAWPAAVRDVDDSIAQVAPEHLSPTWYAEGMVSVPVSLMPFRPQEEHTHVTVIDPGSAFGLGDHLEVRLRFDDLDDLDGGSGTDGESSAPDDLDEFGLDTARTIELQATGSSWAGRWDRLQSDLAAYRC